MGFDADALRAFTGCKEDLTRYRLAAYFQRPGIQDAQIPGSLVPLEVQRLSLSLLRCLFRLHVPIFIFIHSDKATSHQATGSKLRHEAAALGFDPGLRSACYICLVSTQFHVPSLNSTLAPRNLLTRRATSAKAALLLISGCLVRLFRGQAFAVVAGVWDQNGEWRGF